MKIKEIYELKPKSIDTELYNLERHIPEIDIYSINSENNKKVEIKAYVDYCFDGNRTWELKSVWYNNKPIMLIQNAGRSGKDKYNRYITDKDGYMDMVGYLLSLQIKESFNENSEDIIDENYDGEDLTNFYGHEMKEFYDNDFTPKYKIGDIIDIDVPKNREYYISNKTEKIKTQVEVLDVTDIPYNAYRVKEILRKVKRISYGNSEIITIEDYNKLSEEKKKEWEDIYYRLNSELQILNN